ncbi:MAG TPA: hypothetical protein VGA84_15645 [Thermoanaerobaculia bacterium]
MYQRAYASTAVGQFKQIVSSRVMRAAETLGRCDVVVPIGLMLLVDKANGGDATADELSKRFDLIDSESRDFIDFHFVGWRRASDTVPIEFSLDAFAQFREALRKAGVTRFGGNADLILVDAALHAKQVSLDFENAINVDLSDAVRRARFPSLGLFLQTLIDVAESGISDTDRPGSAVFAISDRLGVTFGSRSLLAYFLDRWGAVIGAGTLASVSIRRIGRRVSLRSF